MNDYMVTTIDNPFNPYTQWDAWNQYDHEFKHCTWELIDRLGSIPTSLPQSLIDKEIDHAVEILLSTDYEQKFIKVTKDYDFEKHKSLADANRVRMFN